MRAEWKTYTPDGRELAVVHEDGLWAATCAGNRSEGATAHAAIAGAVGHKEASIGTAEPTIAAWVAAHAARLEAEI